MGRVINLHEDKHRELQDLLPWYVTGQLDDAERARLDAHVSGCAECQAEVRFQQRLEAEVSQLPLQVEESWSRMRDRIAQDRPSWAERAGRVLRGRGAGSSRGDWLGWAAAVAMIAVSAGTLLPETQLAQRSDDIYHVLGAAPGDAAGNLVVIFRPDATEQALREALRASGARLVDGPTAADGYVLHVAPERRPAAMAILRGRTDVVLAEPIDPGVSR